MCVSVCLSSKWFLNSDFSRLSIFQFILVHTAIAHLVEYQIGYRKVPDAYPGDETTCNVFFSIFIARVWLKGKRSVLGETKKTEACTGQ